VRLLRSGVVLLSLSGTCFAQVPDLYKTVNRVTWVVENIDKVRPAWAALGLSGIEEYPNIQLTGEYRGKPITIYAWQITGHLGNLTVDLLQPGEGQANAYTDFLAKHGDGILSIVHEVKSRQALEQEILRMKRNGVAVLQQVRVQGAQGPVTYTYFDTEREGKFALGLVHRPGGMRAAAGPAVVSHFGAVVWDAAAVSAYWEKLGFPSSQSRYEWIAPPASPPNIFADFLNKHHREGIHHIGMPVADLAKSVAAYEKLGYHVRQAGAQHAYMDTESVGGISVELVQSQSLPTTGSR
jgi:hypothetical protein